MAERLIFPASLANNPKAIAREAHRVAQFYRANTRLPDARCRAIGLSSALEIAERQRRIALGIDPVQVAQALQRIATAALTEPERRVWHAERALVVAEHSDAWGGHRKVADAREALADAQREAA